MLSSDGDLVSWGPHHPPIFPLLFEGDQSSLKDGIVHEGIDHNELAVVDLNTGPLAATDDVPRVQLRHGSAAGTCRLNPFFVVNSFLFPHTGGFPGSLRPPSWSWGSSSMSSTSS